MKFLDVPMSGSRAGITASRNRGGQYFRTRATPTQPRTDSQVSVRENFGVLSQGWKTLSAAQQDAWRTWGENHPRTDSLGQSIKLTGLQAYVGVNQRLMMIVQPPTLNPPDMDVVSEPAVVIAGDVPEISTSIAPSDPLVYTSFFFSLPKSQGTNFNGDYRFIYGAVNDDTLPTEFDLAPFLVTKFGTLPETCKFFVRYYHINVQGVWSPWKQTSFNYTPTP